MKLKAWMVVPAALVLAACDSGGGGGGKTVAGVAGADNCTVTVPMSVTGELTPMYSWDVPDSDDGVFNLSVIRVENIDYIASNPTTCFATTPGAEVDERCKIAYARTSGPDLSNPEVPQNIVTSPVMHGAASSGFDVIALTQESPLENGVEYQASVVRALDNNSAQACGCMRFVAGTADSSDTLCGS